MKKIARVSILLALVASPALAQETFTGTVTQVTSGNLFVLSDGTHVRLWGIDAPKNEQVCDGLDSTPYPCGLRAQQALDAMVRGRLVHCETRREHLTQGRRVATCTVDGMDLSSFMVGTGFALDDSRYSMGRYLPDQMRARFQSRGIWSGRFELPNGWRGNQHS